MTKKVINEKNTENLTRKFLADKNYYNENLKIITEEQKSENKTIQNLLRSASKSGNGIGKPEFIISGEKFQDFVIVIECKGDTAKHQSKDLTEYADYAVDGVLKYASHLKDGFNVIAIAVSGEKLSDHIISTYIWAKNAKEYTPLINKKTNKPVNEILSFDQYIAHSKEDEGVESSRLNDLISFSKDLHQYIYEKAKLSESEKPLLVSGILLSLMNESFRSSYEKSSVNELGEDLVAAIEKEVKKALNEKESKRKAMMTAYQFLANHDNLNNKMKGSTESPLLHIIREIDKNVFPFINDYHRIDVLGKFYHEFLRYVGGDKKGLGIVLTPTHITELFCELEPLGINNKVLDPCMGTSSFLISAMDHMTAKAKTELDIKKIKEEGLYGIELQPNMFALAATNMILRGDGKSNLYQGSCLDESITSLLKEKSITHGFINPPYSQQGEGLHELDFIYNMLNCLQPKGIGIAIVPMSCAIAPHSTKKKLLDKHKLLAVMSMPDELFYPVGVVSCIMVFEAHTAHEEDSRHETWFGYWKVDGFEKTKVQGRIDLKGNWKNQKEIWLSSYRKKEIPEFSVFKKVSHTDEWCAEAYLETDYSSLTDKDFFNFLKQYELFKLNHNIEGISDSQENGDTNENE